MAFNFNPLELGSSDFEKPGNVKGIMQRLGNFLNAVIQFIQSSSSLASVLNLSGSLTVTALNTSLNDLGTVSAASSTIDTRSAAHVFVRVSYTGTTAYTITLNNFEQGALLYLRIANNAVAARTITVAANTPASVVYTVSLLTPTNTALSAGVSVTNGQAINGFGISATVLAAPVIDMVGSIG